MSFFKELKRRNVFRVGAAYAVVAWLLIQVVDTLGDLFALPDVIGRTVVILFAIGFPVALIISWVYEVTPAGITTQDVVDAGAKTTSGRKLNAVIISSLVLAVIFMAVDNYVLVDNAPVMAQPAQASAAPLLDEILTTGVIEKSIAVLPFRDLSPNGDQGWFTDGISEEISNLLTSVPDLQVINTSSSFQFRDQEQNFQTIRDVLGVNYLLSGSLRRAGDDLRITVQLSSTDTGSQLWSDNYSGQLDDVFAFQEGIAESVSNAMQVTLGTGVFGKRDGMTRNVEAYESFLKGVANISQDDLIRNIRETIDWLERAVSIDPSFTMAYVAMYQLYTSYVPFISGPGDFPEQETRPAEILALIRQSNSDDPILYILESIDYAENNNWIAAEESLNKYLNSEESVIIPGDVVAVSTRLPEFLRAVGRVSESVRLFEQLRSADPLSFLHYFNLSETLGIRGDLNRALAVNAQAREIPGQETNVQMKGSRLLLLMAAGDTDALKALPLSEIPADADRGTLNATMVANLDNPEDALAILRTQAQNPALSPQAIGVLSAWAAYFDDSELALNLLKARYAKSSTQGWLIWRPLYDDVRKLPEFKDLVAELGLVDYWRTTGNWGDFCQPLEGSDDFECF